MHLVALHTFHAASLHVLTVQETDNPTLQALDTCTELEVLDLEGNCVSDLDMVCVQAYSQPIAYCVGAI